MIKKAILVLLLLAPAAGAEELCETPDGNVTISSETLRMVFEKCGDTLEVFSLNTSQPHEMYQIDAENFEWEMHFAEADGGHQPTSNVLIFRMKNYKDYDFFYQPPLANLNEDGSTWEDDGHGISVRPENANGSYAVYWKDGKKRNNEYKTGKVCHIYRPYVVADNNEKAWCDLSVSTDTGYIRVTIPKDFYDTHRLDYLDPTFGLATKGATARHMEQSACTTMATLPVDGTITKLTEYIKADTVGSDFDVMVGYYNDSSGAPNTLVTSVNVTVIHANDGWVDANVSDVSCSAGVYHLADLASSSAGDYFWTYYDNGSSLEWNTKSATYPTFPSPYGTPAANLSRIFSIYATYTASGGSPAPAATGFVPFVTMFE